MIYREILESKLKISKLGFGCMRLPRIQVGRDIKVNDELAVPLIRHAFDLGINYFDTAWTYCGEDSERALGIAIKPFRGKVYISTKLPMWNIEKPDDFWFFLEKALEKLDTDYIDFYHFHSVNQVFWDKIKKFKLVKFAEKAKSKGYIKHISFSFHDDPSLLKEIVDTGDFESVLCQYNILNSVNEEAIDYAKQKGLGVFIMGSLAGGNVAHANENFVKRFGVKVESSAELGLKFVWGNKNVDCALSGMETTAILEENIRYAESSNSISIEEWNSLKMSAEETNSFLEIYCTDCQYCFVCPKNIRPAHIFKMYNNFKTWGLRESSKKAYQTLCTDEWWYGNHPDECIECGECSKKCPQKIDIPKYLKKATDELKTIK